MSTKDEFFCRFCHIYVKREGHALSSECAENQAKGKIIELTAYNIAFSAMKQMAEQLNSRLEERAYSNQPITSFRRQNRELTNPNATSWKHYRWNPY